MPKPNIFFWIAATVTDTAAVYLKSTKTILANGMSTVFIKDPRRLPKNCPNCAILDNLVF